MQLDCIMRVGDRLCLDLPSTLVACRWKRTRTSSLEGGSRGAQTTVIVISANLSISSVRVFCSLQNPILTK